MSKHVCVSALSECSKHQIFSMFIITDDLTQPKDCIIHVTGTTCDCGRYRKVVGQMDINISKLKNAVKFLKNGETCVFKSSDLLVWPWYWFNVLHCDKHAITMISMIMQQIIDFYSKIERCFVFLITVTKRHL